VNKKLIVAMVVVGGALGLAGCSHKKQASSTTAGTSKTTTSSFTKPVVSNNYKPKKW